MRLSILSVASLLLLAGCELLGDTKVPDFSRIGAISYTRHVQFLFDEQCTSCHAGADAEAGLALTDWESLVAGSSFGGAVVPFEPERSTLYRMLTQLSTGPHPREAGADTLSGTEVAFLRRWIAEGARADDGRVPYADAQSRVYAAGATVTVLDAERMAVAAVVDLTTLGFSPARYVAAARDGSAWYASLPNEDAVVRFGPDGLLPDGLAAVPSAGPVAVSADGAYLVVGRSPDALRDDTAVSLVRTDDLSVARIEVGVTRPQAVAFLPSGYILCASLDSDRVVAVDPATGTRHSLALTGSRHGIAALAVSGDVSGGGSRAFALGEAGGRVVVIDTTDPTAMRQLGTVDAGANPTGLAWDAESSLLVVSGGGSNTVTLIDPIRLTVAAVIRGSAITAPTAATASAGRFFSSSLNASGQYLPRHDFRDSPAFGVVSVIDPITRKLLRAIEVDPGPVALGGSR